MTRCLRKVMHEHVRTLGVSSVVAGQALNRESVDVHGRGPTLWSLDHFPVGFDFCPDLFSPIHPDAAELSTGTTCQDRRLRG